MARGGEGGVDPAAVHDLVERALAAMEDVRKVKSQLTGAKTNIDRAYEIAEEMAGRRARPPGGGRRARARPLQTRRPPCPSDQLEL